MSKPLGEKPSWTMLDPYWATFRDCSRRPQKGERILSPACGRRELQAYLDFDALDCAVLDSAYEAYQDAPQFVANDPGVPACRADIAETSQTASRGADAGRRVSGWKRWLD